MSTYILTSQEYMELKQKAELWDGLKTFIQEQNPEIPSPSWRTKMGIKVLAWVFGDGDVRQGRLHHPFIGDKPRGSAATAYGTKEAAE